MVPWNYLNFTLILILGTKFLPLPVEATFSGRFLVAVNATWDGPNGCVAITSTEHFKVNETTNIHVGNCDYGPLSFLLLKNTPPPSGPAIKDYYVYTLHLQFGSHAVLDASHPTCDLNFNGTYVAPNDSIMDSKKMVYSPLPSCFTMDSREGENMTYFWFHLLEWTW